MNQFKPAQQVVHNGFDVPLSKVELPSVNLAQIRRRCFKDQIKSFEIYGVFWLQYVIQFDDVAVAVKSAQQKHFAKGALGVRHVGKELIDLLDSDALARYSVDS